MADTTGKADAHDRAGHDRTGHDRTGRRGDAHGDPGRGAQGVTGQLTEGLEATVQRIRDLNERVINAAKSAGQANLDAYEKALASFLEVEHRLANASQLDWVQGLVRAQSDFVQSLSDVYVKAAREALK